MPKFELTTELVEHYEPMVRKVARIQWKQATILETEDIEQAVWEHILREGHRIFAKTDGTPRTPDEVEGLLHRAASKFCRAQREDYQYFSGAFIYSGQEVEALLEEQVFVKVDDIIDIEGRLDMIEAFSKLTVAQERVVYKKFHDKETLGAGDRKTLSLAIERMTSALNSGQVYERLELDHEAVESRLQGVR